MFTSRIGCLSIFLIEVNSYDAVEERDEGGIEIDDDKLTPECIRQILESDPYEDLYECPTQLDQVEVNDSPEDTWKDYSPDEDSDSSNSGGESSGPNNNTENDCQEIMTNAVNERESCLKEANNTWVAGMAICVSTLPLGGASFIICEAGVYALVENSKIECEADYARADAQCN
ncbi:hypothetical protein [Thiomicrorhabdus sp.]|uniref:hypothetical protein n=1 Tax=Thiomicrorhabdus sp. TaxID=2039724 RepID=UPI0029C8AA6E|nr:hypothetical protein [Thiomicrorhabdus sp.]